MKQMRRAQGAWIAGRRGRHGDCGYQAIADRVDDAELLTVGGDSQHAHGALVVAEAREASERGLMIGCCSYILA